MAKAKAIRQKPALKLKDLRATKNAKGGAARGQASGKPTHESLTITKEIDK